jgi:membrane-associated phospholipid phosphatase
MPRQPEHGSAAPYAMTQRGAPTPSARLHAETADPFRRECARRSLNRRDTCMQTLNLSLFEWIAAGHDPHPQLLWIAAVVAKQASWACVAFMGWMAWRNPSQRAYIMCALAAAGVAALTARALADVINLPRPFMIGLSPAHIEHGARGSLPSTHATVMFAVALIFCLRSGLRTAGLALMAGALVTAWARIHVGVHFPFDIVAGLLLGGAIAVVFQVLVRLCQSFILPHIASTGAGTFRQSGTSHPPE